MAYFYEHLDVDIKLILLAQIRNVWTHHSTSLEGNSLTLGETDFILEEGLTIQGKPIKDHNEIYGHARAIELIYQFLNYDGPITKEHLFQLHQTILTEHIIDIDQPIGKWKTQSNFTTYVDSNNKQVWREYPSPKHIDQLMQEWLCLLNHCLTVSVHSQEKSSEDYAQLHLSFVTIHPFFDGNGRLARLLANLPVLKAGFPPIVVPQEDRYRYKQVLSTYQNTIDHLDDLENFCQLPVNNEWQSFIELCRGYWSETMTLLATANEMQLKRK
jgi:Fic family protein